MLKHSRQMYIVITFFVILVFACPDLLFVSSIRALSEDCNELCGNIGVQYPFYINAKACGKEGFELKCRNNSSLVIELNKVEYKVTDIDTEGIIINPLQPSCSANLESFNVDMENYAISSKNYIQFSDCKNKTGCSQKYLDSNCNIPSTNNSQQCKNKDTCCFPLVSETLWKQGESNFSRFSQLNCTGFSSWVIENWTTNLKAEYGLKLEWGIQGNCKDFRCDAHANCTKATNVIGGVRCSCKDGYRGDGFLQGAGCIKECTKHGKKRYGKDCKTGWNETKIVILAAALVAAGALVAGSITSLAFRIRRRNRKLLGPTDRRLRRRSEGSQLASLLPARAEQFATELFTFKTLDRATKGFADAQTCGHGACGTVYAGRLPDGRHVAVKRMHYSCINNPHGAHQLLNEISLLSTIKHKNLVQLLGCCLEEVDPILVYEFVPNGTLAEHLQREPPAASGPLDWRRRCAVAADAAAALAYLHGNLSPPVYHRDVKSSNILLDFDFNCKVADFGLSRLAPFDGATHISTAPQGTPGYLDPDYHQTFHLSDKSDVYSFGVVLVEIITGLKPVDFNRDKKEICLASLAIAKITSGRLDDILDPFLQVGSRPRVRAMVHRVAELAFRCLSYDKDARPAMAEVAAELAVVRQDCEAMPYEEDLLPADGGESPDKLACSPTSVQALWPSNSTALSDSFTYSAHSDSFAV